MSSQFAISVTKLNHYYGLDALRKQVLFDINMRLSQNWPRITKKKPALPDAEEWKDKTDKLSELIR
jgi:hypothetical protein